MPTSSMPEKLVVPNSSSIRSSETYEAALAPTPPSHTTPQRKKITHPFRLRHQKERPSSHHRTETPIDEIRPIPIFPDRLQHDRRRPRNRQIEQPLCRGRQTHIQASQAIRRDLRHVYPAHRTPPELKRRGVEIHHHQCAVAGSWDRGARHGRVEAAVKTEVEHAETHEVAGPDEGPAAAEGVGEEEDEDGAGTHLDDAVDARGEEGLGVACYAEVGEDDGGVVVDRVGLCRRVLGQWM